MEDKPDYDELTRKINQLESQLSRANATIELLESVKMVNRGIYMDPPLITLMLDRKGRILDIDHKNYEVPEKSKKEIVGKLLSNIVSDIFYFSSAKEDPNNIEKWFRQCVETGSPQYRYLEGSSFRTSTRSGDIFITMVPVSHQSKKVMLFLTEKNQSDHLSKMLNLADKMLTKVLDSIHSVIYVVDMTCYELLYLNGHGVSLFGSYAGKKCWEILQKDQNGPCEFCTNEILLGKSGPPNATHVWEFRNTKNNNWYQCHDTMITWTDGRPARLEVAIDITHRKQLEERIRQDADLLETRVRNRTRELEDVNTALNVLLKKRDRDKKEIEEKIASNYELLVLPFLEKLESAITDPSHLNLIKTLHLILKEILSPFSKKITDPGIKLTPTEVQVANLVKLGKTNKEIAQEMTISFGTVSFHRENIRLKLGLRNKKTNLRSFLTTHL